MTATPARKGIFPEIRDRIIRCVSLRIILCTFFAVIAAASCSTKSDPADQPLTEDERYLIDTYIEIVGARNLHGMNPSRAESLFTAIDSTTDSLRIANTITAINTTPERWLYIFEILDNRIQRLSREEPE